MSRIYKTGGGGWAGKQFPKGFKCLAVFIGFKLVRECGYVVVSGSYPKGANDVCLARNCVLFGR